MKDATPPSDRPKAVQECKVHRQLLLVLVDIGVPRAWGRQKEWYSERSPGLSPMEGGPLVKCRFWFNRPGQELEFHITKELIVRPVLQALEAREEEGQ